MGASWPVFHCVFLGATDEVLLFWHSCFCDMAATSSSVFDIFITFTLLLPPSLKDDGQYLQYLAIGHTMYNSKNDRNIDESWLSCVS